MSLKNIAYNLRVIIEPLSMPLLILGIVSIIIGLYKIIPKNIDEVEKKVAKKFIRYGSAILSAVFLIFTVQIFNMYGYESYTEEDVIGPGSYIYLRTIDVQNTRDKALNIISSYGGTIKSTADTEDDSVIGFVVPGSKSEDFKTDIKELVFEGLYNQKGSPIDNNIKIVSGYMLITHVSVQSLLKTYMNMPPEAAVTIILCMTILLFIYSNYRKDKQSKGFANITNNETSGIIRDLLLGIFCLTLIITFIILSLLGV